MSAVIINFGAQKALFDGELCGSSRARPPASAPRKNRAPAQGNRTGTKTETALWALENHACRHCFGRLVSRPLSDSMRLYRCTNCETDTLGTEPDVLCCCGVRLVPRGVPTPGVEARIRCVRNPSPTPEFPSVIVATEAGPDHQSGHHKP